MNDTIKSCIDTSIAETTLGADALAALAKLRSFRVEKAALQNRPEEESVRVAMAACPDEVRPETASLALATPALEWWAQQNPTAEVSCALAMALHAGVQQSRSEEAAAMVLRLPNAHSLLGAAATAREAECRWGRKGRAAGTAVAAAAVRAVP